MLKKVLKYILFRKKKEVFYTQEVFKDRDFNIGDHSYGNPRIFFENSEAKLSVGKFCSIAEGVNIFLGGNHRVDWVSTYPFNKLKDVFPEAKKIKGHPETKGSVIIENDVWIGFEATIMSGVKIGNGAVIAAGALVTKNVGDYEIWGGNPAKIIGNRFEEKQKKALLKLKWWDWDLIKIKDNVELLCSKNIDALIKKHLND